MNASAQSRPQSAEVRLLLEHCLVLDEEFQAFCLDYFPRVHGQLSSTMTRTAKLNLLLQLCDAELDQIVARLAQRYPERYGRTAQRETPPTAGAGLPPGNFEPLPDPVRLRYFRGLESVGLSCDRSEQWQALLQIVQRPGAEATILPGPQGEAHEYFLQRIHEALPGQLRTERPLKILHLSWPEGRCPKLLRDLVGALAATLGCRANLRALRSELARVLRGSILLLTQPCLDLLFDRCMDVMIYYQRLLPEVLVDIAPTAGFKLVQPVEWADTSWLARFIATLLPARLSWVRRARSATAARTLIAALRRRRLAPLPVVTLAMLRPIEREHVVEFLDRVQFPKTPAQRSQLVHYLQQSCRSSVDILRWLAQRIPQEIRRPPWASGPQQEEQP